MEGLIEGRIVHFVMHNGKHRPAIITHVWSQESGMVNSTVFIDPYNDGHTPNYTTQHETSVEHYPGVIQDDDSIEYRTRTWHWTEKA